MMKTRLSAVLAAGASLVAGSACGQSFNIDLDGFFGPRSLGTGVPQPSFGGAAGQPGYWNKTPFTGPWQLRNLQGQATGVWFDATNSGSSGGGWRNPRLDFGEANDDFWLLMGDATTVGSPFAPHQIIPPPPLVIFTFAGLEPGLYDIYTYAVLPPLPPRYVPVRITVPGSLTENPQLCTGPMPLDWVFRRGVTHSVHRIEVSRGQIEVWTTGPNPESHINGFQIVKVK